MSKKVRITTSQRSKKVPMIVERNKGPGVNPQSATPETSNQPPIFEAPPVNSKSFEGFDLNSLRLPQNFDESLSVKKHIVRVPVRKPGKTDFFRTHPAANYRLNIMVLELKEQGEIYALTPNIFDAIPELAKAVILYTAVDRHNNVFLIPVPLPGLDGRRNQWHESLSEVVGMAESRWVRISANMKIGGYDALIAESNLAEPEWPEIPFSKLVEIGFRGRVIDSVEHPVIRQLMGAA